MQGFWEEKTAFYFTDCLKLSVQCSSSSYNPSVFPLVFSEVKQGLLPKSPSETSTCLKLVLTRWPFILLWPSVSLAPLGPHKHQSAVTCLQFNKNFVITSSDDGTVKLWDLKTGEFIRNLVTLESGGSGGVVWRIRASNTKLVCAVGSRNGTEETKLLVLDFDVDMKWGGPWRGGKKKKDEENEQQEGGRNGRWRPLVFTTHPPHNSHRPVLCVLPPRPLRHMLLTATRPLSRGDRAGHGAGVCPLIGWGEKKNGSSARRLTWLKLLLSFGFGLAQTWFSSRLTDFGHVQRYIIF